MAKTREPDHLDKIVEELTRNAPEPASGRNFHPAWRAPPARPGTHAPIRRAAEATACSVRLSGDQLPAVRLQPRRLVHLRPVRGRDRLVEPELQLWRRTSRQQRRCACGVCVMDAVLYRVTRRAGNYRPGMP